MKYACLIYLDEEGTVGAMSKRDKAVFINEVLDNDEAMRMSGNYVDSAALEFPSAAISVRVRNGDLVTTDGPFVETKEWLTGLVFIEARDLNDAVRLAGRIPMARHGTIEVRPVRQVDRMETAAA
jgi:hypothetical protein